MYCTMSSKNGKIKTIYVCNHFNYQLFCNLRQLKLEWLENKQKLCILNFVLQLSAMKLLPCHWPGKGLWPPGQSHQYHPWGKMKPTLASQAKLFWLCHCLLYRWTVCHLDGRQVFTPRRKPGTSGVPWPGMNASAINRKTGNFARNPPIGYLPCSGLRIVQRVGYVSYFGAWVWNQEIFNKG